MGAEILRLYQLWSVFNELKARENWLMFALSPKSPDDCL